MYYLDLSQGIHFIECEFRKFYQGEHHISRRWNTSVLLLLLKNTIYFEEDGKEISVPESTWYIQRPNLYQRGTIPSPSPEYFYIHFNGSYVDNASPGSPTVPVSGKFDPRSVYPLMRELYDYQNDPYKNQQFENILMQYLLFELKKQTLSEQNSLAYQIANFISQNFTRPISLKDISSVFGYCEDYLGRIFKKQFKLSIYKYITNLRIQKAKQLLLYSEKSISQISEEVGYLDHSLFYKAFQKEENTSPVQWKKENNNTPIQISKRSP